MGGHSLLIRVCAKKKKAFFIISFSIRHVYRHASLLHWVHVLGRVRMRASFWDSILVYVLGDSMSCLFDFCERSKWPFFRVSGSLLYPLSHLFQTWLLSMLLCRLTITHFPIFLSSPIFILFLLFSSCLMFDLGSTSTLYSCLFDMSIPLSSLFVWGPLGPGLMTLSMHCISRIRGMGIISLGSLSLVSFHLFHPITLAYLISHVWRPPWGHYFSLCLIAHTWAILEFGWRLFHRAWWMRSYDMIYTGVYPFLLVMDFRRWYDLYWGIPHSSMTVSFGMTPNIGA